MTSQSVISEVVKKIVSTERVSMEDNATRSEELDIYKVTYPLYVIYLKIFLMLVATILMLISSVMVILTTLKGKCQQSAYCSSVYFFAIPLGTC